MVIAKRDVAVNIKLAPAAKRNMLDLIQASTTIPI